MTDESYVKKLILILASVLFLSAQSIAAEPEGAIVQIVRRNTPAAQTTNAKEYYLNIGEIDEVKSGDVFHVIRQLPVTDILEGEPLEFLPVIIGEVQVTNLGKSTAVARLLTMQEPELLPSLEYPGIMLGDQVKRKTGLPFK